MTLPNSRNTNYQAAGGELKPKDLDDLQDGIIDLYSRPPVFFGRSPSLSGVYNWSGAYLPFHKAFAWAALDLADGISLSFGGETLRGTNVAGPGSGLGATELSIVSSENSNVVLVCRNAASATNANRLCRSTDLSALASVTVPAISTSRPLLWWTGVRFWGTFDGGSSAHVSTDGLNWFGAGKPHPSIFPQASAHGTVTIGSSTFNRFVACNTDLAAYSDDNGATWSAFAPIAPVVDSVAWCPGIGFVVAGALSGAPSVAVSLDGATWSAPPLTFRGVPAGFDGAALRHIVSVRGRLFALLTQDATLGDFTASVGGFLVTSINGSYWEAIGYEALGGNATLAGHQRPLLGGNHKLVTISGTNASFWG